MKLEISLAPDGNLLVHLPSGRSLELGLNVAGLGHLRKLLTDASLYRETGEHQRGYIGAFPSQSIIDGWLKEDNERKLAEARERRAEQEAELGFKFDDLNISI